MPKPVTNLYTACMLCTNLDTPCTLELLLGHSLYTEAVYMLGHRLGHVYISKQFPSLGIPTSTAVQLSFVWNETHSVDTAR